MGIVRIIFIYYLFVVASILVNKRCFLPFNYLKYTRLRMMGMVM